MVLRHAADLAGRDVRQGAEVAQRQRDSGRAGADALAAGQHDGHRAIEGRELALEQSVKGVHADRG